MPYTWLPHSSGWLAGMPLCSHAFASYFLLVPPYKNHMTIWVHKMLMYKSWIPEGLIVLVRNVIINLLRGPFRPQPSPPLISSFSFLLLFQSRHFPANKKVSDHFYVQDYLYILENTWSPHFVSYWVRPQCHHQLAERPVLTLTFSSPHKQRLFLLAFLKQTFSCKQKSKWLYLCTRLFIYYRKYLKASLCFPMGLSTISSSNCWEALFALELLTLL